MDEENGCIKIDTKSEVPEALSKKRFMLWIGPVPFIVLTDFSGV